MRARRILIADDNYFVADDCANYAREQGADVLGPYAAVEDAAACVVETDVSGAILNADLQGVVTFGLADVLMTRSIPFAFYTGVSKQALPPRFSSVRYFEKPGDPEEVVQQLLAAIEARTNAGPGAD